MGGIYALGSRCYAKSPNRLFAHQLGDGFVIVGESRSFSLEQPAIVGILLLRQVLRAGGVARGAISEGDFADISSYYPEHIQDLHNQSSGGPIQLGEGLMTILPVMGTALINSFRLLDQSPKGPLLLISERDRSRLPGFVRTKSCGNLISIDWVHSSHPVLDDTARRAGFSPSNCESLYDLFSRYVSSNEVPAEWRDNASAHLGFPR